MPSTRRVGNQYLCGRHWLNEVTIARARAHEANEQLELLLNAPRISSGELMAADVPPREE